MTKNDEPKQVPVDIEGHPLPELTPEQRARRIEIERERLMKTSLKLEYKYWRPEEKRNIISWAINNNYETKLSEFKHLVEAFKLHSKGQKHQVLRSMPSPRGTGRTLDVWCMNCGRIHEFEVPLAERGIRELYAPCKYDDKPDDWKMTIEDTSKIQSWEYSMIERNLKKAEEKNNE